MAKTVTLIPRDGTGPEVPGATREVIDALEAGIEWEVVEAGEKVVEEEGEESSLPEGVLIHPAQQGRPQRPSIDTGWRGIPLGKRASAH